MRFIIEVHIKSNSKYKYIDIFQEIDNLLIQNKEEKKFKFIYFFEFIEI